MKIDDLIIEVRDADLNRVGQLLPADLVNFSAVLRYNKVGSWKAVLPVGHRMADYLRQPDAGLIITTTNGVLLSGPVTSVVTTQSTDDIVGTYEISGTDDSVLLTERLAYPTPTTADVTAQTSAYDVRTGSAEDVIKGYVNANIGPSAPAVRQVSGLTIEASAGRGSVITGQARFETLQELLTNLANVSDLGFTIEQNGSTLQFQVFVPTDRTSSVRLDIDNGKLTKSEYTYAKPKATRIIVGGDGTDVARVFTERTSTDSLAAESVWARRIEVFDSQSASDLAELQQAADEILSTDGLTQISVSISPSDDQTMRFGVDWNLGDKVTCVIGNLEVQSIVTEVGLIIQPDGVRIGATVGEPRFLNYETQILTAQTRQGTRISKLERN